MHKAVRQVLYLNILFLCYLTDHTYNIFVIHFLFKFDPLSTCPKCDIFFINIDIAIHHYVRRNYTIVFYSLTVLGMFTILNQFILMLLTVESFAILTLLSFMAW